MSRASSANDKSAPLLADADDGSINDSLKDAEISSAQAASDSKTKSLVISFVLMVVIGLGNKIFQVRFGQVIIIFTQACVLPRF